MSTSSPRQTEHPIDAQFIERWSPRAFSGEAVPEAALLAMLEAARWAPSASNLQPWRFVYALAGTPAFDAIVGTLVPFNQSWAGQAGAMVVVLSESQPLAQGAEARPNRWSAFDAGAAWAQFALQAHLAGWVTHAMGGFDAPALLTALQAPSEHVVAHAVVAVGRQGPAAALPEALQAREAPSSRLPLSAIAAPGRYPA